MHPLPQNISTQKLQGESFTAPKLQSVGMFSCGGPTKKKREKKKRKRWNIKRCPDSVAWVSIIPGPRGSVPQPWGNRKLSTTLSTLPTSPSSDRSTWSLSQKSQSPSGNQGKLDKWKARGRKVGRPVILYSSRPFLFL